MNFREVSYRFATYWKLKYLSSNIVGEYIDSKIPNPFMQIILKDKKDKIPKECMEFLPDNTTFKLYGVDIHIAEIEWSKDYVDKFIYPETHISKIKLHKYLDREVKNVLELHRLHFLVGLAIKYNITSEKELLDSILYTINNWIDKNPFPYGMGWVSPTIVAKRLVSLLFVWNLISLNDKKETVALRRRMIKSFNQHIYIVINTLSLYSSGNNHLTAELVGVFVTLKSFNNILTKKGLKLIEGVTNRLNKLIFEQNYSDGKNKESAFGYQYQVTDWFFLAYLFDIRINQNRLTKDYEAQLRRMFLFFRSCFDEYGNFYDYGDRDNFHVMPFPYKNTISAFSQFLKTGAIIFKDNNLKLRKSEDNEFCDFRNVLLFDDDNNKEIVSRQGVENETIRYFDDGGHVIVRFKDNKENDIYFHFRGGELGYLSIAAHAHSDLNSFYLTVNGQPVFIDTGTYCYRKDIKFRNYFRGIKAHNTVAIGGYDHAVSYGINHWNNQSKIKAKVSGYENKEKYLSFSSVVEFPNGAKHIRYIKIEKENFKLFIKDKIISYRDTKANVYLHLAPGLKYKNGEVSIQNNKSIVISTGVRFKMYEGVLEPEILGWYSPEFSEKVPIQSLKGDIYGKENEITITIKQ